MALMASGCGGGSSSSTGNDEVTVQTGSLTKAEFVEQADAICKAGREQFDKEFQTFQKEKKLKTSGDQSPVWLGEVVNTILLPDYEKRIEEISALGAPSGDEREIASFLNALQQRLDDMRKEPAEMSNSLTPFSKPIKLAKAYGFTGCAESLS